MGGTGDLLSLALSVPPWEDLHRLSRAELRLTNLVTTDAVADVLPRDNASMPVADAKPQADAGSLRQQPSRTKASRSRRSRPRPQKRMPRPAASNVAPAQPQK